MGWLRDVLRRPARLGRGVHFVHNTPALPNLGDAVCSPKHYFDFASERSVLIVGGGAYSRLGIREARRHAAAVKIAWGIGSSVRLGLDLEPFDARPALKTYDRASSRDRHLAVDGIAHIPCVSCFHPIADIPPGSATGLFINRDEAASGAGVLDLLSDQARRRPDLVTGTNAMGAAELGSLLALTGNVVTNSYHIAYWSLLSGRSVTIVGYSTKFLSLLDLFDLQPFVSRYVRGDSESLAHAVDAAFEKQPLRARPGYKAAFRHANLAFADSLASLGVDARLKPAEMD